MSEPECPRAGRIFGGCKFEARYDECSGPVSVDKLSKLETFNAEIVCNSDIRFAQVIGGLKQTYVRDVCTRCGRTVERK